jgi:hypothetical protein
VKRNLFRVKCVSLLCFFLLTSVLNFKVASASGMLEIAPYLFDLQSNGVTVMAVSDAKDDVMTVKLKDSGGHIIATFVDRSGDINKMNYYGGYDRYTYKVTLTGLESDTTYKYDVNFCDEDYNNSSFTTAPALGSNNEYKFAVWGDTQHLEMNTIAAKAIAPTKPRILLHVGDLMDEGKSFYSLSTYLFEPAATLLRNGVIVPAAGNHDSGAPYLSDLFPTPKTNTSNYAGNMYYSYDCGDAHFVVIHWWDGENLSETPRIYDRNPDPVNGDVARVKKMLEEDAASPAATAAKWRIVIIHMPPDEPGGTADQSTKDAWNTLLPYLKKYDPNMVFFGHTHYFDNTRVINQAGLDPSEIKGMTTGLMWSQDGVSIPDGVQPSFVEGFMNYKDPVTGKTTMRLKPTLYNHSTKLFDIYPKETIINPPSINGVPVVTTSQTSATIQWNTDVNADSRVDYGIDRSLSETPVIQSGDNSTSHTVTLSSLKPGTTYYFRVKGKGSNDDIGRTDLMTFTTAETNSTQSVTSPAGAIINASAAVNYASNTVDITGTISTGINQQITYALKSPSGEVTDSSQVTSGENGFFRFTSQLSGKPFGEYQANIGEASVPISVKFTYDPSKYDVNYIAKSKLSNAVALYIGSPKAYVNNTQTLIDTANSKIVPFVQKSRTLVPVRFISEKFKANVVWNGKTATITITKDNKTIKLKLGSNKMYVNGKEFKLDVPAQSISGRTFIPLRALVEYGLGKKVFYDRQLIVISDSANLIDPVNEWQVVDAIIQNFK